MTRQTHEFAVFVASPSDLTVERDAVVRAARSVNEALGSGFGLRLIVEGWEQVQPALGRPQALINPLVEGCDIFVGLLSHRWGSPTGTHGSGFEEEFELILSRAGELDPPTVGLFFAQVPSDRASDPGPELTRVLEFQRKIRDEHTALYKPFDDTEDLERKLLVFFTTFLARHAARSVRPPEGALSSAGTKPAGSAADEDDVDDARRQLGQNLESWANLALGRSLTAGADRDRLLAFALAMNQDHELLGTHVANRLYRRRTELALSFGEVNLWLRTLSVDVGRSASGRWDRSVPGLAFIGTPLRSSDLAELALDEAESGRGGALDILRLLRYRPLPLWGPEKLGPAVGDDQVEDASNNSAATAVPPVAETAQGWLGLFTSAETRTSAIRYLYELASSDDEALLQILSESLTNEPWASEVSAVIAALRGDPTEAVAFELAHTYGIREWAVDTITRKVGMVSTPELSALIASRQSRDEVRVAAFRELAQRSTEWDEGVAAATVMLSRSDATRSFLFELVREPHAVLGEWAKAAWDEIPEADRPKVDVDERLTACTTSPHDLEAVLTTGWAGLSPWVALSFQGGAQLANRAREVLRTRGATFSGDLAIADEADVIGIKDFIEGRACGASLRILASLPQESREQQDLALVRDELDRDHWLTREPAVLALAELGEPDDASRLLNGATASYLRGEELEHVVAIACRLGGRTVARSLLEGDNEALAAEGAAAEVADPTTTEGELIDLLYHRFSTVRRRALDGLLTRLDLAQLQVLLDEYPTRPGTYYYNVVAALDWEIYGVNQVTPGPPAGTANASGS